MTAITSKAAACRWLSARLYLRTMSTSNGVPGGAPVEKGRGEPKSNLALTAPSTSRFTATMDVTSKFGPTPPQTFHNGPTATVKA